jgi:hypothetical protein
MDLYGMFYPPKVIHFILQSPKLFNINHENYMKILDEKYDNEQ